MKETLPLINDELEIVSTQFDFIKIIHGYDNIHQNFRTENIGYNCQFNVLADHRDHGTVCLGSGLNEASAITSAFKNAWEYYTNEMYRHSSSYFTLWETQSDIEMALFPGNPYNVLKEPDWLEHYNKKLKAILDYKNNQSILSL